MNDPRIDRMARVLVQYSLALQPGDVFRIVTTPAAAPLVRALYRETLAVGAHPLVQLTLEETEELLYRHGSDAQLDYVSPMALQEVETIDATIRIMASDNTRSLSGVDADRMARRRR